MPRLKTKIIIPVSRKYVRRSEEQLIADLEARIQGIKLRAATKTAAKTNPSIRLTNQAVRAIDQALSHATNATHKEALTEARTVLVAYFQLEGLKIPQKRGPRFGRQRTEPEAHVAVAAG